jgi:hypothetical protein
MIKKMTYYSLMVGLVLLLGACNPAGQPLHITNVSVTPEPVVGRIVTLEVEIMSTEDEADVIFTVDTLESAGNKIHLVSGEPRWQGSLTANQPQVFQFSVCVVEEGSWPIDITVVSYLPNNNVWDDFEIIQIESSITSGRLIRGQDYTYSQEEAAQRPTPRPITVSPECSGQ